MRTNQEVYRDIKNAPYRDIEGIPILPGQFVALGITTEGDMLCAPITIKDGDLCVGGVPIDDVIETQQLWIQGWMQ